MIVAFFGKAKFRVGALFVSDAVAGKITLNDLSSALNRHTSCDWGEVDDDRRKKNKTAMRQGGHVVPAFIARNGIKFHVITEWNRSVTSVLLPDEE